MSYPQPPQQPYGQVPPGGYPPPGQYLPGQWDPGQYPPDQGPPQEQQAQRRRGCRGCIIGCLVTFLVIGVLFAAAVAAGIYVVRQMFPTTESAQEAAGCAIMRVIVTGAETAVEQSDATPAEKEQVRREFEQLRREFEQQCGPLQ